MNSNLDNLLATMRTQIGFIAATAPEFAQPHVPTIRPMVYPSLTDTRELHERFRNQEATRNGAVEELVAEMGEHEWNTYDSSDIHQRQAEWEAQAAAPVTIQQYTFPRERMTHAQFMRANAALANAVPGVQLGENMRQHRAHDVLSQFVGLDLATSLMQNGE